MAQKNYPGAQALLEKFYEGKCTPEELEILDQWYESLGDKAPEEISAPEADYHREQFLAKFRGRQPAPKMLWWKKPVYKWAAAASILLLAGAAYILLNNNSSFSKKFAFNKTTCITNETNGIKQVTLPDSSRIWLNAYATLSWNNDFNQHDRCVELTGEGYFDIEGSAGKPFIIRTRDMAIRVLGTQFNVEAYTGEKTTRVALVQGKVQVNARKDNRISTVLQPGYAAVYSNSQAAMLVSEADAGKTSAWKNGAFTATDIPLKDAVTRLCIRNGYQVRWENTQDIEKNISVMFKTESFIKMLENICYISRKQYKISDREVTIY